MSSPSFVEKTKKPLRSYLRPSARPFPYPLPTGVRIGCENIELRFLDSQVSLSPPSLILTVPAGLVRVWSITLIMRLPVIQRSVSERVIADHRFRSWTRGGKWSHLISQGRNPTFQIPRKRTLLGSKIDTAAFRKLNEVS